MTKLIRSGEQIGGLEELERGEGKEEAMAVKVLTVVENFVS